MPGTSDEDHLEPDLRLTAAEGDADGGEGVGPVPGGVSDPTGGAVEEVADDDPMEGQAPTG